MYSAEPTRLVRDTTPPPLVAKIAIVVAREGTRAAEVMEQYLDPIEIKADDLNGLALRVGRYGVDAIMAIGVPAKNQVGSAIDAAVSSGTPLERAGDGEIVDRDA